MAALGFLVSFPVMREMIQFRFSAEKTSAMDGSLGRAEGLSRCRNEGACTGFRNSAFTTKGAKSTKEGSLREDRKTGEKYERRGSSFS